MIDCARVAALQRGDYGCARAALKLQPARAQGIYIELFVCIYRAMLQDKPIKDFTDIRASHFSIRAFSANPRQFHIYILLQRSVVVQYTYSASRGDFA